MPSDPQIDAYLQLLAPINRQIEMLAQLNGTMRADVTAAHSAAERAEAQTEDIWSSMEAGLNETNQRVTAVDRRLTTVQTEMLAGFDRLGTDQTLLRAAVDALRSAMEASRSGTLAALLNVMACHREVAALRLHNENEFTHTRAEIGNVAADLIGFREEVRGNNKKTSRLLSELAADGALIRGKVEDQGRRTSDAFRALDVRFDAADAKADRRYAEHERAIGDLRSDITLGFAEMRDRFAVSDQRMDRTDAVLGDHSRSLAGLTSNVTQLNTDVAELKVDVAQLKVDVAELKVDVAELKVDVAQLKTDVAELKVGQARIEAAVESLAGEVRTAFAVLTERIDRLAA